MIGRKVRGVLVGIIGTVKSVVTLVLDDTLTSPTSGTTSPEKIDDQNVDQSRSSVSTTRTVDNILHKLWTDHIDGNYDKSTHKPLWIRLQLFVEENGGLQA